MGYKQSVMLLLCTVPGEGRGVEELRKFLGFQEGVGQLEEEEKKREKREKKGEGRRGEGHARVWLAKVRN